MKRAVLLVGHGTIHDASDVPEFLRRIRRGRPPSPELVAEITRRYAAIGGSPLLDVTRSLARALSARLGLGVHVAMRFWAPLVADVLREVRAEGVTELAVLPVAPFSVALYAGAVAEANDALVAGGGGVPALRPARPYGSDAALVAAHADAIRPHLDASASPATELVLTAHSLPLAVLRGGDDYQREFEDAAARVSSALGFPASVAYQSQGDVAGEWLGPTLAETFRAARDRGTTRVVVAPIGFLADHVETLYDLDVEAAAGARSLGLELVRVRALNDSPELVAVLAEVARRAFAEGG